MKMKLKKLLKNIPVKEVKGPLDIEVTGICSNSKLAAPGSLFIAKKGVQNDGEKYIPEAIAAGAIAILTDIANPSLKNITQIIAKDIVLIEGLIGATYHGFPSEELFLVGITGTNGKTTTSFLIKHLLEGLSQAENQICGLIGTIEYVIGAHRYPATRTTPGVIENHKMLKEMVLQGCKSAVMEVSSHALDQHRVENINFDIAIFTNLSLDHLDYHQTMESYAEAKSKLFSSLNPDSTKPFSKKKAAIVNGDSPWSETMTRGCKAAILTYGIEKPADLLATNIQFSSSGTTFDLQFKGKSYFCKTALVGRFNVYNYLAAVAVGVLKEAPLEKSIEILSRFSTVPGRLELIKNDFGRKIYVDFAHSPDALKNVLKALKEFSKKRIITVFGCGGDRDKQKRSKMAEVAEEFSDITIITSDNPRSENPESIINEILTGFKKQDGYLVEIDRYLAIKLAIEISQEGDLILIAGKGHETYQIFDHKTIEFDDKKVAEEICLEYGFQSSMKG